MRTAIWILIAVATFQSAADASTGRFIGTRLVDRQSESTADSSEVEPDYTQEYVPPKQPDGGLAAISNARLTLYFEMPALFIALVIGLSGLICRRHKLEEENRSDSAGGFLQNRSSNGELREFSR